MRLKVNGSETDFAGSTVNDLLERYRMAGAAVAVERNGVIIHRQEYAAQRLAEGDVIEIVRFVGGG